MRAARRLGLRDRPRRAAGRRARAAAVGPEDRAAVRLQRRRERALRPARDRDVRPLLQPGLLHQPAGADLPAARRVLRCAGAAATTCAPPSRPTPASVFVRRARGVGGAGTVAVGLLAWAGARLFDRRVGAASPRRCWRSRSCPSTTRTSRSTTCRRSRRCAWRWSGIAGVLREGRTRDFVLAGAGLGLACATKYTAGIVLRAAAGRGGAAPAGRRAARAGDRRRRRARRLPRRQPVRAVRLRRVRRRAARAVRGLERRRAASSGSPTATASPTTCAR